MKMKFGWFNLFSVSFLIGFVCAVENVNNDSDVPLSIDLKAPWLKHPFVLDVIEAIAGENPQAYFSTISALIALAEVRADDGITAQLNDQEVYRLLLEHAVNSNLLTKDQIPYIDLSLAAHRYSALIEAQYQYFDTWSGDDVQNCENVLVYNGEVSCDTDSVFALKTASGDNSKVELLPTDRIIGSNPKSPIAILYGDLLTDSFSIFHTHLISASLQGKIQYILRYKRSKGEEEKESLTGYGVEVNLKRTDYLVIDDRFTKEEGDKEESKEGNKESTDSEEESDKYEKLRAAADNAILHKDDIPLLGFKASNYILSNPHPFDALLNVSLDFPNYSKSISQYSINDKIEDDVMFNVENGIIGSGQNAILINGAPAFVGDDSPFDLLNALDRERRYVKKLVEIGFKPSDAGELITKNIIGNSLDESVQRFDYRTTGLIWLNDIEQDPRFVSWSTNIKDLLTPLQSMGQLHQLRHNINSFVFALDFTNPTTLNNFVQSMSLASRGIPVQIGIIPIIVDEATEEISKHLHYLSNYAIQSNPLAIQIYLGQILSEVDRVKAFKAALEVDTSTFNAILEDLSNEEITSIVDDTKRWMKDFDVEASSPALTFANGVILENVQNLIMEASFIFRKDLEEMQGLISKGEYTYNKKGKNNISIRDYLVRNGLKRRNVIINPADSSSIEYIDVSELVQSFDKAGVSVATVNSIVSDSIADKVDSKKDGKVNDIDSTYTTSWIIGDFDKESTIQQLLVLLEFLDSQEKKGKNFRVKIVPTTPIQGQSGRGSNIISILSNLNEMSESERLSTVRQYLHPYDRDNVEKLFNLGTHWGNKQQGRSIIDKFTTALEKYPRFSKGLHIIYGGRVVNIPDNEYLQIEDLDFLNEVEEKRISGVIRGSKEYLKEESDPFTFYDKLVSVYTTTYYTINNNHRVSTDMWKTGNSSLLVSKGEEKEEDCSINLLAVIDPLSEKGQEYVSLISSLDDLPISIKVILNPKKLNDIPVKRFYKSSFPKRVFFEGGNRVSDVVRFDDMPQNTLLSLGLKTPNAWIVTPSVCDYDLDNIVLSTAAKDGILKGTYSLNHILIEGHASDVTLGNPPRGLALDLGTVKQPHMVDTIVMANLGYLQLKANPGLWIMSPKQGQSLKIFDLVSIGLPSSSAGSNKIWLTDMTGITIYPKFIRRPGMEYEDVLDSTSSHGGTLQDKVGKIWSIFGKDEKKEVVASKQADINIFTVASGHLYERFLGIMTASVMRHTNHTVKFWLIENFLSPSFKEFLPTLAEEYKFDYELVTYNWPHWLRGQKEKQRTIWGYKILFLDTLFPQTLDKVIFVDSDQIVRTDLKELVDFDLEGAPYGYTPMGDSRKEMEGFRFWKQGYWKKYLDGLPYHISALYVIDLKRFRELAAGDRLRKQYQLLSADPNSLSNLDQDLPNNMQKHIPIKSLPQDWLWCETWCDDESLATAKTIDLCNNPLTKEPKLDRARRQIPEWTEYDDAIYELHKQFKKKKKGMVGDVSEKVNKKKKEKEKEKEVENDFLDHDDL